MKSLQIYIIVLFWSSSTLAIIINDAAYCTRQRAETIKVPIRKTKVIFEKSVGFISMFKVGNYRTVNYIDYVDRVIWKMEHVCCDGYQMNAEQKCEPHCTMGCPENAYCEAPEYCVCQKGYQLEHELLKNYTCKPQCAGGCMEFSRCVKPNNCQCFPGFRKIDGKCMPVCVKACPINSECYAPNMCICNAGYEKTNDVCVKKYGVSFITIDPVNNMETENVTEIMNLQTGIDKSTTDELQWESTMNDDDASTTVSKAPIVETTFRAVQFIQQELLQKVPKESDLNWSLILIVLVAIIVLILVASALYYYCYKKHGGFDINFIKGRNNFQCDNESNKHYNELRCE